MPEFKLQALEMAETSGKSIAQIEDVLGLAPGMLNRLKRWFKKLERSLSAKGR